MSVPSMMIEPCSGRSRPIRDFRNTDLPVPEGPSSTLTSPGGKVSVTSCQILCDPKDLVSPSTDYLDAHDYLRARSIPFPMWVAPLYRIDVVPVTSDPTPK